MPDLRNILDKVPGDGGETTVSEEDLTSLKGEMQQIKTDAETGIWSRRRWAEDVRFCRWEGQSDDGRKHKAAMSGKEPHPFEGASDSRIRLADMIIGEHVIVKTLAATQANLTIKGMETNDEPWAAKIRTLLRYVMRGRKYMREIVKLAQYEEGDSPAAALLGVFWRWDTGLQTKQMSADEFVAMAWRTVAGEDQESGVSGQESDEEDEGIDEDFAADVKDLIENPDREEEALLVLEVLLPAVAKKRARRMLRAWQAGEVAEFMEAYDKPGEIRFRAYRLFDDVFIPTNTGEVSRARAVFVREWMSEPEIREKIVTEGWSKSFVEKVLGKEGTSSGYEGKTLFPEVYKRQRSDGSSEAIQLYTADDFKGLYEIIYPYWKAVNDDGVRGVFWTIMHGEVDETAVPRQLCPESEVHGEYPFVDFSREILNDRLIESRGVTELCMTDQQALKLNHDSVGDHAQMSIPSIFVPQNRPNIPLKLGPLRQIRRRRTTDYEWMKLPDYPQSAAEQQKETRRRVDEYFGRYNPEVDERLVIMKQQFRVNMFLAPLADAMVMAVQLCQANMSDEQINRIVGGAGVTMPRGRKEIQGQFDLWTDFDVRNLDPDYVLKLAKNMQKYVLPMDKRQTVQSDKLVQTIMRAWNPQLAETVLRPAEEADKGEVDDEEMNFVKIKAGIEPEMMEEGQNFELRYARLVEIMEQNPAAVQEMSDTSKEILKARMDHLEFMVQQEENKMIGRVGAKPALEDQD